MTGRSLAAALFSVALGCSSGESAESTAPANPAVEVFPGWYESLDLPILRLEGGGPLPLRQAPQGGHWAFVSAQVRGIESGELQVRVRLHALEDDALVFAERRVGSFVPTEGEPGLVEPDLDLRGAIAHVPACPVSDALPIFGRELRLVVEVAETGPAAKSGAAELRVTPACAAGTAGEIAVCECECAPDYNPGKCY